MRWGFRHLDISDPRERIVVGAADLALGVGLLPPRLLPTRRSTGNVRRILLLRLERIGDLLMSLGAIQSVRTLAPDARDRSRGRTLERADRTADSRHQSRRGARRALARTGRARTSRDRAGARRALSWRSRHYDLAINFEGDIRTHLLPWLAGASRRVGFAMAGGGPLLTDVVEHDGGRHVAANSLALVERAFELAGRLAARRTVAGGSSTIRAWSSPSPLDPRRARH